MWVSPCATSVGRREIMVTAIAGDGVGVFDAPAVIESVCVGVSVALAVFDPLTVAVGSGVSVAVIVPLRVPVAVGGPGVGESVCVGDSENVADRV